MLFSNQRSMEVEIPTDRDDEQVTVREAMAWMRDHVLVERPEMFMKGDTM